MGDVVADGGPKLPSVLAGPGLRQLSIGIENGVRGVEDPFESGAFFKDFECVGGAHAAVVHAVFVDWLEAGVEEHAGDFADAFEHDGRCGGLRFAGFEAHDADEFGAQFLHAGDGTADFVERDIERGFDGFRPVHDGGAEAVDLDAVFLKCGGSFFKSGFGDFVKVRFVETRDEDAAHLDMFPA